MRIKDSREGFIRPDSLAILFPVGAGGQKINAPLGNEVFLRKRKSDFENNTLEELLVGRARGATQADVVLDDIYKQCHLKLKDENIFANYQFNYF